jgi:apolipoprotein N-acyltransferase
MQKNSRFSNDRFSLLWLAVAFLLLFFSNGIKAVPLAAWIGPLFMLRFLRKAKPAAGLIIGYLVCAIIFYFQWGAAFQQVDNIMFALYTVAFGLLAFLPYIADRLISPHIKGFLATLIFPAAWVALEYLVCLLLPLGTFFNLAYTQNTNLPLLQMMSVTGLWGVSFLVTWFSSVVNFVWERDFNLKLSWKGATVYGLILAIVLMGGGLRLAYFRPMSDTVRVSVLTTDIDEEPLPDDATPEYAQLVAGTLPESKLQEIQMKMDIINADLFRRAKKEARAGSKIITFSEFNVQTLASEEQRVLEQAKALAREEQIYLVFPLEVTEPDMDNRQDTTIFWVNKSMMITPEGEIAYQYLKHNLLVGPETEHTQRGERDIQVIDTPYGTLANVICLDMEYPNFMRLAAFKGTDIVLSGAIDGIEASNGNPFHAIMASYRTIESGFSLARAGYYGKNIVADYQGRMLAWANHYTAGERTVTAWVPTKGVKTIYAKLGDYFPISACIFTVFVAILSGISVIRKKGVPA